VGLLDTILSPITGLADSIIKRIWPNKELAQQHTHTEAMGQQAINTAEAQTSGSGGLIGILKAWRGFIGWACGIGMVWQLVVRPLLIGMFPGHNFPGYAADEMALLGRVLLGMLGLGG
jgi:spore maturation protein SpmA